MNKNFLYHIVDTHSYKTLTFDQLNETGLICGVSENNSKLREMGLCVPREELDDQPVLKNYCGPMYDGTREINGEIYTMIRYESREAYEIYSR